jgi:hypothetical protein
MTALELKQQTFELPSQGRSYSPTLNLINGTSVNIRPWTAGDQRYFAVNQNNLYEAYTTFVQRLVIAPKPLESDLLLMEDVNAIVFAVRIMSFGVDYPMPFICKYCREVSQGVAKLDKVNLWKAEEIENFSAVDMELKLKDHTLLLHRKTLADERMINSHMNTLRNRKMVQDEDLDRQFVTFAQQIDSIDGKQEAFQVKFEFLNNLSQGEYNKIGDFLNKQILGLESSVLMTCEKCKEDQEARLVITPEFFRPSE